MTVFISRIQYIQRTEEAPAGYPYDLPWVQDLDLHLSSSVTFLVGENGSGKSTLIEAIADAMNLPVSGGGREEAAEASAQRYRSELGRSLRPTRVRRVPYSYFFRAEASMHLAEMLEARRDDPDFLGDPFGAYGGSSLQTLSHGESFMAVLQNRFDSGLLLMDEPESALSPQRQLALIALLWQRVARGDTQIIAATHSPLLMTFPGATILDVDDGLAPVELKDTAHFQITRDVLNAPERFWKHLRDDL